MSLHLLGVVRATHEVPAGRDVRLVVLDDLAAAVREAPVAAMSHFEALSALVATGPVVPVVFGTLAESEEAVRADVLAPRANGLRAQLDRLADVVEVHVYLRLGAWTSADTALEPVSALAEQAVELPSERQEVRRAFLVSRERLALARQAAEKSGGRFAGPLPAFSFLNAGQAPASRWGW
ncbi:GvpL/GvpF family gas vesicle protein [Lentzea sp. NPDC004789]